MDEEENKIENSSIEDSKVEGSKIVDSEIKDSHIEDSKIEDSKIIGGEVKNVHMDEGRLIKERKEKFVKFLKKPQVWVIGILIVAIILGVYIRSMPMHVRPETGNPGLWDITTNTWTLGPDLDPWLFTRYAETIVEEGRLPDIDMMRNVPRGFETS